MTWIHKVNWRIAALLMLAAAPARAQVLTAERAVAIALLHSPGAHEAQANVLDARSGLFNAYSGILPHLSADATRDGQWTTNQIGNSAVGGIAFPPRKTFSDDSYFTNPVLSANWSVLDLSNWV